METILQNETIIFGSVMAIGSLVALFWLNKNKSKNKVKSLTEETSVSDVEVKVDNVTVNDTTMDSADSISISMEEKQKATAEFNEIFNDIIFKYLHFVDSTRPEAFKIINTIQPAAEKYAFVMQNIIYRGAEFIKSANEVLRDPETIEIISKTLS